MTTDSTAEPDRWSALDFPVLLALARAQRQNDGNLRVEDLEQSLGVRFRDIRAAVDNLNDAGYLRAARFTHDDGGTFHHIALSERGLREVRAWPTEATALDRMLEQLQAIADNTDTDDDTRSRARRILDNLAGTGRDIGVSVAAAIVTGQVT